MYLIVFMIFHDHWTQLVSSKLEWCWCKLLKNLQMIICDEGFCNLTRMLLLKKGSKCIGRCTSISLSVRSWHQPTPTPKSSEMFCGRTGMWNPPDVSESHWICFRRHLSKHALHTIQETYHWSHPQWFNQCFDHKNHGEVPGKASTVASIQWH